MTRFGPFSLEGGVLSRGGEAVAIGRRGLALLEALAAVDGAVGKDALIEGVWSGLNVEEVNLSVQIAGLRKALGQRPDGQEWIVTVPRVGYRLLRDTAATRGPAGLTLPLLAVLPVQNIGGSQEEKQFADGVAEDLANALGLFRDFELLSPHHSGNSDGPAVSNPGIRYLLEGGVRHAGRQLRITTQLVDGESGAHIWTDRLDRPDDDIFAAQDEVTHRVTGGAVAALQIAEIERAKQQVIPSVYTLYQQALSKYKLLSPAGHAEGIDLIRRALALEPRYARALSHGAMVLSLNYRMGWPELTADDASTCAAFIEGAEVGVSNDARVLGECSNAMIHFTHEYRRGLELARRACKVNPFDMQALRHLGVASIHCGDLDEAVRTFKRAFQLSPEGLLAPVPLTGLAHVAIIRGDYEEALGWAEKSLAISARYDATYWMLIAANAHLGRLAAARSHLAELLRRVPNQTVAWIKAGQPDYDPTRLAAILDGLRLAGMP